MQVRQVGTEERGKKKKKKRKVFHREQGNGSYQMNVAPWWCCKIGHMCEWSHLNVATLHWSVAEWEDA